MGVLKYFKELHPTFDAGRMIAWLFRALGSPRASQLVDWLICQLGEGGFERYLRLVALLTPGESAPSRAIRTVLAFAPSPRDFEISISARPAGFIYVSSPVDVMQYSCRLGFAEWEPITRWFFYYMSQASSFIIDVGSYSGVFAMTAAKANPRARIVAVEPDPLALITLEANLKRNAMLDQVHVISAAAGANPDTAPLYFDPGQGRMASLLGDSGPSANVQIVTLDSLVGGERLDLMKIDVEGGELEALRGASLAIQRDKPVILIEALSDYEFEQQSRFLEPFGYRSGEQVCSLLECSDSRNFVWTHPESEISVRVNLDRARLQMGNH